MSQAEHPLPQTLDITDADWQQTPPNFQQQLLFLLKHADALEARRF